MGKVAGKRLLEYGVAAVAVALAVLVRWLIDPWVGDYLPLATPDAQACNEATETKIPYVRVDWFVFAASKPPLYHVVLGVPPTDQLMELLLRVSEVGEDPAAVEDRHRRFVAAGLDPEGQRRGAYRSEVGSRSRRRPLTSASMRVRFASKAFLKRGE